MIKTLLLFVQAPSLPTIGLFKFKILRKDNMYYVSLFEPLAEKTTYKFIVQFTNFSIISQIKI